MNANFLTKLFQKQPYQGSAAKASFKWQEYFIILLPFFYFFIGTYFRQLFGDLSLRSTDPEYMHFASALCIASGKIGYANIDSPGSLLQGLMALIFRIIYIIRQPEASFFEDAVLNSDLYLSIASTVFIALISLSIYFAGRSALKVTGSLVLALLIQSTPFIPEIIYDIIGRITPEVLFPLPLFLLQIALLKTIYNKYESERNKILLFALAIALGLSLKSTFIALAILPFFAFKGLSNNIKYFFTTILLFSVLALPVTLQISHYFKWLKGLLLHDGVYGQGGANVINFTNFKINIIQLLNTDKLFFSLFLLFIITVIICLIKNRWKLTTTIKLSIGMSVSILIFTFIMGKQYQYRYFIPALYMLPIMVILFKEELQSMVKWHYTKPLLLTLIILLLSVKSNKQIFAIESRSAGLKQQMDARIQTRDFAKTIKKGSTTIIVSQDYGSPFHEYAIMYTFCWVRPIIENQNEVLNKMFPNVYQYFTWDNSCRQWGEPFNFAAKVKEKMPLYIFIERNDPELLQRTLNKYEIKSDSLQITTTPVFVNNVNNEAIYEVGY